MKLIKTLHGYKTQFLTKLPSHHSYLQFVIQLCALCCIAAAIWYGGPLISWRNQFPLVHPDKRMYIITSLFLLWVLKFLILDLESSNPFAFADAATREKMKNLQSRFQGALEFLRKTTIARHGKTISLNRLPWYLLIGPTASGKTSLLANSQVNFILQRQFQAGQTQNLGPSDNCDWWITRDACVIDVPGNYLGIQRNTKSTEEKPTGYPFYWKFFLKLVKKFRGNHGVAGLIIALPLPEIMKQGDLKKYQAQMRHLFHRVYELQKQFPNPIPCYLMITKCDLLPGFNEFFSESSNEEISQAWGVSLPHPQNGEKVVEIFSHRFNALIKKLNQQLLWRLHQERSPMARPYIKDFPLQVERLKEFTLDFIKKLHAANFKLALHGVYLFSAMQSTPEPENTIIEEPNTAARALQLFKEPNPTSRAYFIKQFLTHGLTLPQEDYYQPSSQSKWKRYLVYGLSFAAVVAAATFLGKDFERGIKQAYAIQSDLSNYQIAITQTQDPDEHLAITLDLLNTLQRSARKSKFALQTSHFLSFYTVKSQQKSFEVYQQALQNVLMPEVRNYLAEYLKNPVNKNSDSVYTVLKAYLMLGDGNHFQTDFVFNTFKQVLPKYLDKTAANQLMEHLSRALTSIDAPLTLDSNMIQQTRAYLASLPGFQLSYIILKNISNNNLESEINLGTNSKDHPIFVSQEVMNQIPNMFTAKVFSSIMSEETGVAAEEATMGNWVLGENFGMNKNPQMATPLIEQLRTTYVNNYIDVWESLLANIHLNAPTDLAQTDDIIANLMSNSSPLLQLLQTIHDNTYFEPIASSSPKLQSLGLLIDKNNNNDTTLYQIFAGLQSLHQYVQAILAADNPSKAAYEAIAVRMRAQGTPDPITQIRIIAAKSPEPVKNWLDKLANHTWHFLLQSASHYLDTAWQDKVTRVYESNIANRYPFTPNPNEEVELSKFSDFFGNPGVIANFYDKYLTALIDTSTPEWHWKMMDNEKLPFSEDALHQLQNAMRIHHMFFPNGDNKLFVQFAMQPYEINKSIKSVKLNMNDKQIVDQHDGDHHLHLLSWPGEHATNLTTVQLTLQNQNSFTHDFPGEWGWFKLVNQTFETAVSRKSILVNLSDTKYPAKYLIYTSGKLNPFLSLNLQHFRLPDQLLEQKTTA